MTSSHFSIGCFTSRIACYPSTAWPSHPPRFVPQESTGKRRAQLISSAFRHAVNAALTTTDLLCLLVLFHLHTTPRFSLNECRPAKFFSPLWIGGAQPQFCSVRRILNPQHHFGHNPSSPPSTIVHAATFERPLIALRVGCFAGTPSAHRPRPHHTYLASFFSPAAPHVIQPQHVLPHTPISLSSPPQEHTITGSSSSINPNGTLLGHRPRMTLDPQPPMTSPAATCHPASVFQLADAYPIADCFHVSVHLHLMMRPVPLLHFRQCNHATHNSAH
ncbi:hypothetical protein BCR44DRAFT_328856 [Catenaria anguillulae PL171]|uniref:Uncharacterized protein n=1 Tax=Catenaria anguillulae PL171 TaxID=765915 RepID=A0A1Y2H8B8_9FUNG|nr:hypothetical protein BCR44DRAFT_328856 [Catenaria anguillulae PL171]